MRCLERDILWTLFTTLLFFLQGIPSMYFASADHTFRSSNIDIDKPESKFEVQANVLLSHQMLKVKSKFEDFVLGLSIAERLLRDC